jgi:sugar phosphate isomerase/epimerase
VKLAFSNIAWSPADDERVAGWMREAGFAGVEIAPTKVWPKPLDATVDQLLACRRWWEARGLPIVSMQALLFGRADLAVFGTATLREQALDYLERIMAIGGVLGAGPLVFGSPKNRRAAGVDAAEVDRIAVDFFRRAGDAAARHRVVLCIEPNPTQYDCDWVTCARQGIDFVRRVGHPSFRLHLDAAGMTLAGDELSTSFEGARDVLRHFHVSEPNLGIVGVGGTDHGAMAASLRNIGYDGWASVEMRGDTVADLAGTLPAVMALVRSAYGEGHGRAV